MQLGLVHRLLKGNPGPSGRLVSGGPSLKIEQSVSRLGQIMRSIRSKRRVLSVVCIGKTLIDERGGSAGLSLGGWKTINDAAQVYHYSGVVLR